MPLSDRWCYHKLIGCWNKWGALCSKTGLGRIYCLQVTPSAGLSRADQFTTLQLSLQPFCLVVNLWCKLDLKERVTTKEIKHREGRVPRSCFLRSLTLQPAWFPDVAYVTLKQDNKTTILDSTYIFQILIHSHNIFWEETQTFALHLSKISY